MWRLLVVLSIPSIMVWSKRVFLRAYGFVEVVIGALICVQALEGFTTLPLGAYWIALFAAMYWMSRGIQNVVDGFCVTVTSSTGVSPKTGSNTLTSAEAMAIESVQQGEAEVEDPKLALERYRNVMGYLQYENTAFWTRSGFMLVGQTALLNGLNRGLPMVSPTDWTAYSPGVLINAHNWERSLILLPTSSCSSPLSWSCRCAAYFRSHCLATCPSHSG